MQTLEQMLTSEVPVPPVEPVIEIRPVTGRSFGVNFATLSTNDELLKSATVDVQVCPRDDDYNLMDGEDGRLSKVSEYHLSGAAGYDAAGVVLRAVCGNGDFETAQGISGMQLLQGLAILWLREQERLDAQE